eukprot:COSAG04_NODE_21478_length_373_cov_0.744526_1_plen_124_part_11
MEVASPRERGMGILIIIKTYLEALSSVKDPNAVEQRLLRSGDPKHQILRSKLMFVGSGRAGKTSLKRRLTGEEFHKSQESTSGIEVDVETWSRDAGATTKEFDEAAAKQLAEDTAHKLTLSADD